MSAPGCRGDNSDLTRAFRFRADQRALLDCRLRITCGRVSSPWSRRNIIGCRQWMAFRRVGEATDHRVQDAILHLRCDTLTADLGRMRREYVQWPKALEAITPLKIMGSNLGITFTRRQTTQHPTGEASTTNLVPAKLLWALTILLCAPHILVRCETKPQKAALRPGPIRRRGIPGRETS